MFPSVFFGRQHKGMDMLDWVLLALPGDLGSKGLRYPLPVLHQKRAGSGFVRIVRCFCTPQDVN
jgi:hypothetical protein